MQHTNASIHSVLLAPLVTVLMCLVTVYGLAQESQLVFTPPTEWMSEPVQSPMRLAQFSLQRADGDVEDAELGVFYFGGSGGTVEANLQRWTNQMVQPDGQTSEEVATTTSFTVNELPVTLLDVPGTYVATVRPGSGMRYNKPLFRLKAAVVETPSGPYFFKMVGPDRTVLAWNDQFTAFLESMRYE